MFQTSTAAISGVAESRPSRLFRFGSGCRLLVAAILCVPAYLKADPVPQLESTVDKRQPSEGRGLVASDEHTRLVNKEAPRTTAADQSPALIDDSVALPIDPATGYPSRPPHSGEKLGYSKEQSRLRLSMDVRKMLDAMLQLYSEPAALTNKLRTLEILGVSQTHRRAEHASSLDNGPGTYIDVFENGLYIRPGWRGEYNYDGWRAPRGTSWFVSATVKVDYNIECIDSKAVEGYLDVGLTQHLSGRARPFGPSEWARHSGGSNSSIGRISQLTPRLGVSFVDGCLSNLAVYENYSYKEIDDDNARD